MGDSPCSQLNVQGSNIIPTSASIRFYANDLSRAGR